jgi:hypothetical protein
MDLLFLPYDAGEAHAFEPLLPLLDLKRIDYRICAVATARQMYRTHPRYCGLHSHLQVNCDVGRMNWDRRRALPEADVARLVDSLHPRCTVTGMVSTLQRQVAQLLKERGSYVIGYFDALHRMPAGGIATEVLEAVDELWVPAQTVAYSAQELRGDRPCRVVGQPSLLRWEQAPKHPGLEDWLTSLPPARRRVLYCTGYGEDFEASFRLFLGVMAKRPEEQVLVSLHPRVPGTIEERVLADFACAHIQIAPRNFATAELAQFVDLIGCYRSTAGFQGLFLPKPVIYVLSGQVPFSNLAIEAGLVPLLQSAEALERALDADVTPPAPELVRERLGLPKDSESCFVNALQETVERLARREL